MQQHSETRPLTASEVREIIGPVDDLVVAQIIGTGATSAEVLEAYNWYTADDHLGGDLARPLSGRVARVHAILQEEMTPPEEP